MPASYNRDYDDLVFELSKAAYTVGASRGVDAVKAANMLLAKSKITRAEKALLMKVLDESFNITRGKMPKSLNQYNNDIRDIRNKLASLA